MQVTKIVSELSRPAHPRVTFLVQCECRYKSNITCLTPCISPSLNGVFELFEYRKLTWGTPCIMSARFMQTRCKSNKYYCASIAHWSVHIQYHGKNFIPCSQCRYGANQTIITVRLLCSGRFINSTIIKIFNRVSHTTSTNVY